MVGLGAAVATDAVDGVVWGAGILKVCRNSPVKYEAAVPRSVSGFPPVAKKAFSFNYTSIPL